MWLWPFGRSKEEECECQDGESCDTCKDLQYVKDLPIELRKDQKTVRRLRKGDERAKKCYDHIDATTKKLRVIRLKLQSKKT